MQQVATGMGSQNSAGSSRGGRDAQTTDDGALSFLDAAGNVDQKTRRRPLARRPAHHGLRYRILARMTLLASVVILSLIALELMTRFVYDRNGMHFGIEMWKYAKKIKRASSNPDMGHEHTPNREAFLMGVPVTINSAGLRDREFSQSKPNNTYRILVLGDSITFGWGVMQDKTFAKVLEKELNESPSPGNARVFEVINTGVGNYNTAQEVAYFKERGRLYHPDMVLIAFFINDAEPTPREATNWLARQSCLYVFASAFWDGILRQLGWRPSYREYYEGLYKDGKPGWIACQQALRDLITACRDEHIDLRIAIVPELHTLGKNYEFRAVHDAVRKLANAGSVPVIDLLDGLSVPDPSSLWVSPGDPHPNAQAQKLFATQLYGALRTSVPQVDRP